MTQAIAGPGFLLQAGDGGSPENFTTVLEVREIKGPQEKVDTFDATNQSSPAHYEELIPTLIRPGQVTFDCNYVPTDATLNESTGLRGQLKNRTLRNYRILDPAGAVIRTFAAYVVGFDMTAPIAGVLTAAVTMQIIGAVGP